MAFYPEWVVLLEDTAKGTKPAELTPRIAQQIIDAITDLRRERNDAEAELNGPPPTLGASIRRSIRHMRAG